MNNNSKTPKALKSGNGSNFVIPFAIVIIGSLIIFGITKMLQNDRGYKDLVRDLHSKTFGNRWVAAFELSKVISSKKVKEEDVPWLVENLNDLYESAVDSRTKNFIIVALGSLGDKSGVPTIQKGLSEPDPATKFHAVVALGSIENSEYINFSLLEPLLGSTDEGLKQATILALSTHRYEGSKGKIIKLLSDPSISVRYAAATGLIYFKAPECLGVVRELLKIDSTNPNPRFSSDKIYALKINVLNALSNSGWTELDTYLEQIVDSEKNLKIVSAIKELLSAKKVDKN
tara:strand:+ start:8474 stop:9337 length:864 start_codon:yes stop_codon:yes gene_type:complete